MNNIKKERIDYMKNEKENEREADLIQAASLIKIEQKVDKKANEFEKIMLIYKSAIKVLRTKFDILNEEFENL